LALLLALPALAADDKPKDKPTTPQEQYQALLKEQQDAMNAFSQAYQKAKTEEERNKIIEEKYPKPEKLAPKFLELAEKNPKDPVALQALTWVVTNDRGGASGKDSPRAKAVAILLKDYVQSDKMGPICQALAQGYDKEGADLLRGVIEKNPSKDVQAEASLALGQRVAMKAMLAKHLKENPDDAKRFEAFLGKEQVEELQKADIAKLEGESAGYFKEFGEKYAAQMKPERLIQLCQTLSRSGGTGGEALLRALLEKDARRDVQGMACLALAQALKNRADGMSEKEAKDAEKLRKESEDLFERAGDKFADVKYGRGKIGDTAKTELFELRHLSVGKEVPEIEGEDADGKKFKLSDYRGKVVLIDFWGHW
jgi:thiol-disulfide isomerase/thioredoxin